MEVTWSPGTDRAYQALTPALASESWRGFEPGLCCKAPGGPETHPWVSQVQGTECRACPSPWRSKGPGPSLKAAACVACRATSYKGCGSLAPPAGRPGACPLPSSGWSRGSSQPSWAWPGICITNTPEARHPGLSLSGDVGGKFLRLHLPPLRPLSLSLGLRASPVEMRGSHQPRREILFCLGKEGHPLG